jgi:hypothetical protein
MNRPLGRRPPASPAATKRGLVPALAARLLAPIPPEPGSSVPFPSSLSAAAAPPHVKEARSAPSRPDRSATIRTRPTSTTRPSRLRHSPSGMSRITHSTGVVTQRSLSLTECFLKPRPNEPLPFPRHGDTHFRAVETWRRVSGSKGAPISCSHCCFRSCSSTTFGVFLASYGGCWFVRFPDGETVRASRLRHQHGGS